ncbi:PH domain-containing protein [Shouchella patagoniensis]|uniref:PH domain-containing protein n=1 Tax=Shouchella patagoniensis TaxID=228576 RepID=UPI001475CF74|nr:PH domain-containing protein [Shouchella patagoniensis]
MNELKRQHPAAIFINSAKGLFQLAVPFAIVAFFQNILWIFFIAFGALLVLSTLFSWLVWLKFKYRLEEGELYVEQGIFVKKKRYIQRKRIQAINISAGLLQRLFGLVKVNIDTAGGGMEAEAELVAVTRTEANRIRSELLKDPAVDKSSSETEGGEFSASDVLEESEVVLEAEPNSTWYLGKKRLIYTALTSSGIGLVISAVVAVLSQGIQFIPDSLFAETYDFVIGLSILLLTLTVFVVLLISWLISSLITIITYGNFKVEMYNKEMVIDRGLIERRQLTLAYKRITAVRMIRSILRQPFGFVSIYVESAGGGNNKEQGSTLLVPLIHERDVQAFLEQTMPEYAFAREIESAPKRAAIRFFIRMLIVPIVLTLTAIFIWGTIGLLGLLIVFICGLLAWFQYRDAGSGTNESFMWLRYRTIGQTLVISPKKKIQSATRYVSILQRRKQLSSFEFYVQSSMAGKSFSVRDISRHTSDDIYNWYSHEKTIDKKNNIKE